MSSHKDKDKPKPPPSDDPSVTQSVSAEELARAAADDVARINGELDTALAGIATLRAETAQSIETLAAHWHRLFDGVRPLLGVYVMQRVADGDEPPPADWMDGLRAQPLAAAAFVGDAVTWALDTLERSRRLLIEAKDQLAARAATGDDDAALVDGVMASDVETLTAQLFVRPIERPRTATDVLIEQLTGKRPA